MSKPKEHKTFKQWWYERGNSLPHDVTKREVAILAWSAAMEAFADRERLANMQADSAKAAAEELQWIVDSYAA